MFGLAVIALEVSLLTTSCDEQIPSVERFESQETEIQTTDQSAAEMSSSSVPEPAGASDGDTTMAQHSTVEDILD